MTLKQINKWEAAWEAYVTALAACDESKGEYSRRSASGHSRLHKGNLCRLRDARRRLHKLDPEFCDKLGISGE